MLKCTATSMNRNAERFGISLFRMGYGVFTAEGRFGCRVGSRLQANELMKEPHYDIIALPGK